MVLPLLFWLKQRREALGKRTAARTNAPLPRIVILLPADYNASNWTPKHARVFYLYAKSIALTRVQKINESVKLQRTRTKELSAEH